MSQTTQQLKGDIDAGRTGDKTPEFDPGLSTLGTDDEAAGSPATPEEVAMARALETRGAPRQPAEQSASRPQRDLPAVWIIAAAFALVLATLALVVLTS